MHGLLRISRALPSIFRSGMAGALLSCGALAEPPFAEKPDWWDAAVEAVPLREADDLQTAYRRTRDQALERFRLEHAPWSILGPFPSPDDLDTRHPPERNPRRIPNATYRNPDGKNIEWVDLSENRNSFRDQHVIYYLSTTFTPGQAGPVWLVPSHDNGMALWVDGRPVYRAPQTVRNTLGSTQRVNLKPGRHELFVKVHNQGGNWSVEVDLYRADPRYIEITALTLALSHPAHREDRQWANVARQLAEQYLDVNDYANAMFWQAKRFPLLGATEREALYRQVNDLAGGEPEAARAVSTFYRRAYEHGVDSDRLRLELILKHLELLRNANDPAALRKQFTAYQNDLERLAPLDANLVRIRLLMAEGELPSARRAFREWIDQQPDLEEEDRVRTLKRELAQLREAAAQLPLDWDFEGTVRQAQRLAEEDPEELPRYIRSIFRDKSGSVVPTADPNLFQGVRGDYQEAFASHATIYQPALDEYLELMEHQLGLTPDERRRQALRFTLTPSPIPEFTPSLPSAGAFRVPLARGVRPLIELNPGSRELEMEVPVFRGAYRNPPTAGTAGDRNGFVIQNSRTVAYFQGTRPRWRHVHPPSRLVLPDQTARLHGPLRPALSDERVFARILSGGRYVLMAFLRGSGETDWTWPEDDRVLCTQPILWGGELLIVTRSPGQLAQYSLAFLDQDTGALRKEIPLLISSYQHGFDRYARYAEPDHYMPDPVLAGETLFVQTNNGVITAIDLASRSTRWARKYSNASWNERPDILEVRDRWVHPPAVVDGVAVFGPMDAESIKAVDAATGELLAREGAIDWLSLHPFGDQLLVIDRERTARILDPATLTQVRELPGRGYRALRRLDGGILLERNGTLELWSANPLQLKQRQDLPGGWRALDILPQGVLMDQPGRLSTVVALSASSPTVEGRPVPATQSRKPEQTKRGLFRKGANALYMVSEASVWKWTGTGNPDWIVPAVFFGEVENVRVLEAGPWVYLVDDHRIWTLRSRTGEVVDRYPRFGEDWSRIRAAGVEEGLLQFALERNGGYDIMLMKGPEARLVGRVKRNQQPPLVIAERGTRVVTQAREELFELTLTANTEEYEIVNKVKTGVHHRHSFHVTENGYRIQPVEDKVVVVGPDASIQMHDIRGWDRHNFRGRPVYDAPRVEQGLAMWHIHYEAWHALALDSGIDLTRTLLSDIRPVSIDGSAVGLTFGDRGNPPLVPRVVDLDTGKGTRGSKLDLSKQRRDWHRIDTDRITFTRDGKAYLLLEPAGNRTRSDENPLLILDPDGPSVRVTGFPDTGPIRDVEVWRDHVWLTREDDVILLPFSEVDRLMEGAQPIAPSRPLPEGFSVDGVHAEWGPRGMTEESGHVFAFVDSDRLVLAGTIQNPDFIRALGRRGIDGRVTLHLRHGPAASFVMDNGLNLAFTDLPEESEFAANVHPAGDRMFYELSIPLASLRDLEFHPLRARNDPHRDQRGDFAFDLGIRDRDGSRIFAHATLPWPVGFPRFFLD